MTFAELAGVIAAGVGVGAFSAIFGVGGGLVMVPFMVLVLGESQHVAEGTSLAVIVPTALFGVVALRGKSLVSLRGAGWVGLGGVAGSVAGASLALRLPAATLERGFGVLAAAVGVTFVAGGVRDHVRSRRSGSGDVTPRS